MNYGGREEGRNVAKIIGRNLISWNWPLFVINVYCAPVSPSISISHNNKAITFKHKSQAHLLYFLILFASIKVTLFNQIQQHQVTKESSLQIERTCVLSLEQKRKCSDLSSNEH